MPLPILDPALRLGKSVVEFGKALINRKTVREKVSHEERKEALDAKKKMADVKPDDPTDRLRDGSF